MLNKEQAEIAAEALLKPRREEQEAAQIRKEQRRSKLASQRRSALFVLVGFFVGGLTGYFAHSEVFPAGLIGMAFGESIGYLTRKIDGA